MQQSLDTCAIELTYEKACRQLEMIYDAEDGRRFRVQNLLLKDECDALDAQLEQEDKRIGFLEECNQELLRTLDIAEGNLESARGEMRVKSRETETLKVL